MAVQRDLTPYLFDGAVTPMWLVSSEGRIQRVNQAFLDLVKLTEDDLIGHSCDDFFESEAGNSISRLLSRAGEGRQESSGTEIVTLGRGASTPYRASAHPMRDAGGGLLGVILCLEDLTAAEITDHDAAETMRRQVTSTNYAHSDEMRIRETVLSSAPYPIFWKDKSLTYLGCNAAMASLCGLASRTDIAGLTDQELGWSREEADAMLALDQSVIEGGEPVVNVEQHLEMPGGQSLTFLASRTPLCNLNGDIIGLVGAAVDITDAQHTSQALGQVQAALDDASDAVLVTDATDCVSYVNLAFGTLFKQTADSMAADGLHSLFASSELADNILQGIKRLEKWEGELEMRTRDGDLFPARLRATPLISDNLEAYGLMFIVTDLTASMTLQQQLLQAQKMESIGQLAAGIAHEINTPTQYISDNVHFLQDSMGDVVTLLHQMQALVQAQPTEDGQTEEAKPSRPLSSKALVEILDQADADFLIEEIPQALSQALGGLQRVAAIVSAMKEFSHPGGKEKQVTDINKALASTITVTTHHWKYVSRVETDFDPELPHIPCLPGELNQAVLNLIVNGVDAITEAKEQDETREGIITVSTRHVPPWVEIRISDTGTGIPPDVEKRVFEPFFTTKEVGKGSGQGLAITYTAIVDKHGGELKLETEVGKGTTFILRIPDGMTQAEKKAA